MSNINEAMLQLIDVVHATFTHSLLHDSPDPIVDRVQIWAVGWPEVTADEVGCLPLQQLDGVDGAVLQQFEAKFVISVVHQFP